MDTFILQLSTITHGGAALGRHEGRAIFVPYALPDETARELHATATRHARAAGLDQLPELTIRWLR